MKIRQILLACVLALSMSAAVAEIESGRGGVSVHDGLCAYSLTQGKRIQTDCSVHIVNRGEMYCFKGTRELSLFASNLEKNVKKANEVFGRK